MPTNIAEISKILSGEPEKEEDETEESETEEPEELSEETVEEIAEGEDLEADEEIPTWASALGVDASKVVLDADGNFTGVRVKVDGKEAKVDLNTLISGYQQAKSTTQKSQALAAEKKEFDAQRLQLSEDFKAKLTQAEQLTQVLHQKFLSDYQGINWQQLRTENPAEYAATIQDFSLRQAGLQQILTAIQSNQQQLVQQQTQLQTKQQEEFLQSQAEKILEKYPTWSDSKIANVEFSKMQNFISDYGYSPEEFAELSDVRAIAIVQDAMKYKAGKKLSEEKISKPVPKFQKSTVTRRSTGTKLDRLVSRAKKTGKREDQVAAVSALISS